ncbi:unnamed protein product [Rhizophagus irregularis]|nr:unnamed protein product [Rhizophagus irregularis]
MRDMKEIIINEVYLMGMVNRHPNIIKIYGVTKFKDEPNYSLVLEYADSGTLGKYLKNNITTFKWQDQMKFANEMASAILCLHDNEIIHGDLHPSNVLIHQQTNDEYVELYQKCWEFEPKDRPDISEIVSTLKSINSEKNKTIKSEENEITKELENDNLSCQIRNY